MAARRPLTLILSDNEFLRAVELDRVRAQWEREGYAVEEVSPDDPQAVAYALDTPSLLGDGRFVILRESVRTSGRKLRAHRGREHLAIAMRYLARGRKVVETREGLDLWYGSRRRDPGRAA